MIETGTPVKNTRQSNGWGIDLNYEDALGDWHDTPQETISAILRAMGAEPDALAPPDDHSLIIVRTGEQRTLSSRAAITLETGESITCDERLPPDLPAGYHSLQLEAADKPTRLIVTPGTCWIPETLETWGWAVQLYAARSRQSWGIGDFADLDRLAAWSQAELGAGMMLVNPLSAATPITPQQESPYYPTSRRFFNPLWLHIPWIPGANSGKIPQLQQLEKAACDLNRERLIQRDKVFELKMQALNLLWLQFEGDPAVDAYCAEQGHDLDEFALFCALAEHHNAGWHDWPPQYRHPAFPAVANFAREHEGRVRFHKWLQWLLDTQLARCAGRLALMQDLPIGVDPSGADAWAWQDFIAQGVGVGAPPDEFNTQGQSWGLPPFVPWKLRAAGYEPFIQTIRAAFRNGGGLRIDHVMGLFRLFWIPDGVSAANGAYVHYNADEMLAIVALESHRAHAYVVGEDLGTVEPGAREKLADHRVMSYRLLWFEKDPPEAYPREALSALTTHDLPTVAGLWTGSDLKKQHELGLKPNEESTAEIVDRLKSSAGLNANDPIEEVVAGAYTLLSRAPSRILTAPLDDALCVEERPNVPATMSDKNPNWSMALPVPIEDLMTADLPKRIAGALKRGGTGQTPRVTTSAQKTSKR
jgi:4-alpha-glucanotransferase